MRWRRKILAQINTLKATLAFRVFLGCACLCAAGAVLVISTPSASAQPLGAPVAQRGTPDPDDPEITIVSTPIPIARPTLAPVVFDPNTRTASLGEDLTMMAAQTGFSTTDLALRNRLTQANALLSGQKVALPKPVDLKVKLHRVLPGETLMSVAALYAVAPDQLRQLNTLSCADCLIVGQLLRVPQIKVDLTRANLPDPFVRIELSPSAPTAGDLVALRIKTTAPLRMLTASLNGRKLHFYGNDGDYAALFGVPALQPQEVDALIIRAVDDQGTVVELQGRLPLGASDFGFENVNVSERLMPLLDKRVNDAEVQQLEKIFSGYTDTQFWRTPLRLPAEGQLNSYFGTRRSYNGGLLYGFHSGMDVRAWVGTPVHAAAPGIVAAVEQFDVRGLVVIIDHGRGVFTAYCHLSEATVKVGQQINIGDVIAKSGNTGRSEGPHIHFELAVNGVQVDPLPWLSQPIP